MNINCSTIICVRAKMEVNNAKAKSPGCLNWTPNWSPIFLEYNFPTCLVHFQIPYHVKLLNVYNTINLILLLTMKLIFLELLMVQNMILSLIKGIAYFGTALYPGRNFLGLGSARLGIRLREDTRRIPMCLHRGCLSGWHFTIFSCRD